jgi:hypothetical protein
VALSSSSSSSALSLLLGLAPPSCSLITLVASMLLSDEMDRLSSSDL